MFEGKLSSEGKGSLSKSIHITSEMNGAPGRIRTSDRLVRSQVLYPAELRAREVAHIESEAAFCKRLTSPIHRVAA